MDLSSSNEQGKMEEQDERLTADASSPSVVPTQQVISSNTDRKPIINVDYEESGEDNQHEPTSPTSSSLLSPASRSTADDPTHPDYYKRSKDAMEPVNKDVEDILSAWNNLIPEGELARFKEMVMFLVNENVQTVKDLDKAMIKLRRHFRTLPKKSQLLYVFNMMVSKGEVEDGPLRFTLIKKAGKSQSGVLVVTVLTSPYPKVGDKIQRFSCKWNCYYCPNEPGQPRSYLHDEPSVLRANRNNFDPVLQFYDRTVTLAMNGHPVDKIELLILGGTWSSYPHEYQESFIRDLFYAANTFYDIEKRPSRSLDEEKTLNETAQCKIIGITLETRPDCITPDEIRRFRKYGCTRVQLGIQHTDDEILEKINRGCTYEDAVNAIELLKNNCYKIDIHLMPNLPGSSVERDRDMFFRVLDSPDLQADQWKIYPCEVTPWTVIKKWYDEGLFKPYSDKELFDMLIEVKARVHPWIRLNRVIRDIPSQYILGGIDEPNLRQVIEKRMKEMGKRCRCIRCREVKGDKEAIRSAKLVERVYQSGSGTEYFISFETDDETILGFVRLRLTDHAGDVFPELQGAALIRELHVYGQLIPTVNKGKSHSQHAGLGSRLMERAEAIGLENGYTKFAVIAGVGVRNFYRKLGYNLEGDGEMLIKRVDTSLQNRLRTTFQKEVVERAFSLFSAGNSADTATGKKSSGQGTSAASSSIPLAAAVAATTAVAASVFFYVKGSSRSGKA